MPLWGMSLKHNGTWGEHSTHTHAHACLCVYPSTCTEPLSPQEGIDSPRAGGIGDCEPPEMVTGHQTQVLYKRTLSSPCRTVWKCLNVRLYWVESRVRLSRKTSKDYHTDGFKSCACTNVVHSLTFGPFTAWVEGILGVIPCWSG